MKIAAVCGSFHKEEIQKMLEYATEEANSKNSEIFEIVSVSYTHLRAHET